MNSSEMILRVTRGPLTESIHHGHIVAIRWDGSLVHHLGNPELVTFVRSTAKLIQAIPVITSGAADHFHLNDAEIALCCASHNGERVHTDTALSILQKIGRVPEDLQCGAHAPYHKPTADAMGKKGIDPTALHNNCSGKHSAMLALAAHLGVSHEHYMEPEHPVQQLMLQAVSSMTGVAAAEIPLGVDGCGVPVFGLALSRLALAYARLGKPERLPAVIAEASARIIRALRRCPEMLAGSDRFDTQLISVTKGRILGKMGAEGVFAVTVPDEGLALVLKVEDGAQRALYPVVTEALSQLCLLSAEENRALAAFHRPVLRNWKGTIIGELVPDFILR